MSVLKYTHSEGIARIVLNNPPQNRLGGEVSQELAAVVMDLANRNDTRVVLFGAEGPDFSFGGDIEAWQDVSEGDFSNSIGQALSLMNLFEALPVPIVVAVQGHCRGGGFEIALRGDVILAADNATFGHSEATIGVFTFLGGIQRVAERVGRTRAMEWALTSEMISADKALDAGLVNRVVPLADLEQEAESWVATLAHDATLAHADHKALLRAWSAGGIEAADSLIPKMAGKILHSQDVQQNLGAAVAAVKAGQARPRFDFNGQ